MEILANIGISGTIVAITIGVFLSVKIAKVVILGSNIDTIVDILVNATDIARFIRVVTNGARTMVVGGIIIISIASVVVCIAFIFLGQELLMHNRRSGDLKWLSALSLVTTWNYWDVDNPSLAVRHPSIDRKSTRLNSSHSSPSRMPSSKDVDTQKLPLI